MIRNLAIVLFLASQLFEGELVAQVLENPQDPFGFAIPYPRVRLTHSSDSSVMGGTAELRSYDPFLFYQLGRDLVNRQYELEHGVLGRSGTLTVPLYVGAPKVHGNSGPIRFARDHSASCGLCHSSVYREPAAGPTIASTGGLGRNSGHFFGAGLVEMIGDDVRLKVLHQYDLNRNGVIDRSEIVKPSPVLVRPSPGAEPIDFGSLNPGPDGVPLLNNVFRVWFVDSAGDLVPDAVSLNDDRVAAFGLAMQPFGWGRGRAMANGVSVSQGGEASSLREFFTTAADFHMGLQAFDPDQQRDDSSAGVGGEARISLNGAQQFEFGGSVDAGLKRTEQGLSLDDPDGDLNFNELTQGDLDAIEFYLLHTPAPATLESPGSEKGREVLSRIGCTRCHVEDWWINEQNEETGFKGDRRLFALETKTHRYEDGYTELHGQLVSSSRVRDDAGWEPARKGAWARRVYSDFKHWDIGKNFFERRYDGSLQKAHRTAPLWGVGTSAPYGHSGRFLTLHDVIVAHDGASRDERVAYQELDEADRAALLRFLDSLVLYSSDEIPSDIDGDGVAAGNFLVEGQGVGYERFDARYLFRVAPVFRFGPVIVKPDGRRVPTSVVTNVREAYGFVHPTRTDSDYDGFPDALDALPNRQGIVPPFKGTIGRNQGSDN